MGKSNRIRSNRETVKMSTPVSNQKKGVPGWALTLITVVITVAILFSFVAMMFSANGVIRRWTKVVSSENYSVNSNMMSYFFATEYNNFLSQYSAYMSSADKPGMLSLNPNESIKAQMFGGDPATGNTYYDSMLLGEFQGTWYDYFVNRTVESVKSMLVYCEYAKDNNIVLDETDYASIDETISTFRLYSGTDNADTYFSQVIAKGVKEKDVRKCLEYSMLANKAILEIAEKIDASVTDTDITSKYEGDKLKYNQVDYLYYSFKVNYDDVVKEYKADYKKANDKELTDAELKNHENDILALYRDKIWDAQEKAKELSKIESAEEFTDALVKMFAEKAAEDAFNSKAQNPTGILKDNKASLIEEIVREIIAEIKDGKTDAKVAVEIPKDEDGKEVAKETAIKVYGLDTTVEIAKIVNDIKDTAFDKVISEKKTYTVEKANYISDEDAFSKWAFADGRVTGERKLIYKNDGEGATKKEDITNKQGQSITYVYYLTKSQYRDDSKTKNFSYAFFGNKEKAEAAIKAMKEDATFKAGTFTTETFESIANENGSQGFQRITDYQKGGMQVSAFDTWLFGDGVTAGSLTATPIQDTSSGMYIVAIYEQEGTENWKVDVKSTIVNERAEAESNALIAKYPINVRDRALKNIKYIGLQ